MRSPSLTELCKSGKEGVGGGGVEVKGMPVTQMAREIRSPVLTGPLRWALAHQASHCTICLMCRQLLAKERKTGRTPPQRSSRGPGRRMLPRAAQKIALGHLLVTLWVLSTRDKEAHVMMLPPWP
jgi:hypothetical protein